MNGPILPFTRESPGTLCGDFPIVRAVTTVQGQSDDSSGPRLLALPMGCAECHRDTILFLLLEMMPHPLQGRTPWAVP